MKLLAPVTPAQAISSFDAIGVYSAYARKREPLCGYCLRAVWADDQQDSFSQNYGDSAINRWNNLCTEEIAGAIGRITGAAGCRTAGMRQRVA
jgi:hypothetical protein